MNSPAQFLQSHRLLISTLSPVHIGSGEDYEPTNYVMDNGVLYAFDTAQLSKLLDEKSRKKLLQIVEKPDALRPLQEFIYGFRGSIPGISTHPVFPCKSVYEKYETSLGKVAQREDGGLVVLNKLGIPRTASLAHTQAPLLPGSSIKGSLRTALLNSLNGGKSRPGMVPERNAGRQAGKLEQELLGGKFQTDPLRLIGIADTNFSVVEGNVERQVVWDCNISNKVRTDGQEARGPAVMREVIGGMNSRCFGSELRLLVTGGALARHAQTPERSFALRDIVQAANQFYRQLLEAEIAILQQLNCLNQAWLKLIRDLLANELGTLLNTGKAILLRVGRHSSADGVTIEGVRSIKIMGGKNGPDRWERSATTLWLAGNYEKSRADLLPFGWILAEIDPGNADAASAGLAAKLIAYNEAEFSRQQQARESMLRAAGRIAEEAAARQHQRQEQEEVRRAEAQSRQALADKLATMSAEQRTIEELDVALADIQLKKFRADINHPLVRSLNSVVDNAQGWLAADRTALLEVALRIYAYAGIDVKKNDKVKKRIGALRRGD